MTLIISAQCWHHVSKDTAHHGWGMGNTDGYVYIILETGVFVENINNGRVNCLSLFSVFHNIHYKMNSRILEYTAYTCFSMFLPCKFSSK